MENSEKQSTIYESVIEWINSRKRDFDKGLELLEQSGYKQPVARRIKEWGVKDMRAHRALLIELRNYLREIRKGSNSVKEEKVPEAKAPENFVSSIEQELQKEEYPAVIKWTLGEFHSLYQSRSILHKELKEIGESNDGESTGKRKRILTIVDAISRRMDILWGIFDQYKKDSTLPEETFFDQPFDPEKEATEGQPIPGYAGFVLPDDLDELKKMKDNLRIKISKAEKRLEFQSDKKGETPNPMPEGPKRAELLKKIEEMKEQKTAVEYKIVELK
jgi:hypothetical protein